MYKLSIPSSTTLMESSSQVCFVTPLRGPRHMMNHRDTLNCHKNHTCHMLIRTKNKLKSEKLVARVLKNEHHNNEAMSIEGGVGGQNPQMEMLNGKMVTNTRFANIVSSINSNATLVTGGLPKSQEVPRDELHGRRTPTIQEIEEAWLSLSKEVGVQHAKRNPNINDYMHLMQGFYYLGDPNPPTLCDEGGNGLGIIDFLKDKHILITGSTGFLGKVLVEKILRAQPKVGQIYLLMKADDLSSAKRRLEDEVAKSSLFRFLQCRHGDGYRDFMLQKLKPVVGDIGSNDLGMDNDTKRFLQDNVELIVHSAATTTFDERYDHALNINTRGPQRIVDFSKKCPKLQLLMHVSTAFVNGERKGLVHEKAFKSGFSITKEFLNEVGSTNPDISIEVEEQLIQERIKSLDEVRSTMNLPLMGFDDHHKDKFLLLAMKELGMERAKLFGWQDTYVFTKAMGEMILDTLRDQVPTVIIRPSVVESSFREPFPGWMEGNRMMDPIIISYGKGHLPGFLVDPNSVLDVVPVDMVVNAMLAAMAKHARKPGLEVYHVASSVVNPLMFSELARMSREHFLEHPFLDNSGNPISTRKLELFQDMDSFMDAFSNVDVDLKETLEASNMNPRFMKRYHQLALRVKEQAAYLANLYRPYTFYRGRFDTSKTQELYGQLSSQEKFLFGFNVDEIEWETYIKRIHIPGLRKHVLKGRGSTI